MGREFLNIFTEWAGEYDETVHGSDEEYAEVFLHYEELLTEIATLSGEVVLEFGSGTGNLTEKLLQQGKQVIAVEPSLEMRRIAQEKADLKTVTFVDGDMETFPEPALPIDTIVSSFVFHHLTETEKRNSLKKYAALLPKNGKLIFGDTVFISPQQRQRIIDTMTKRGNQRLVADLEREYYPLLSDLEHYFQEAGFQVLFKQMNAFVWLMEAVK